MGDLEYEVVTNAIDDLFTAEMTKEKKKGTFTHKRH
jgi:hypothetical protein